MKTERIKNIVIVLLIISSLVLSCQIWFNEKIWPDGYNFFDSLKNTSAGKFYSSIFGKKSKNETVQEDILVPYNLFVYMVKDSDHAGYMLTANDENFTEAKSFLHSIMGDMLSKANDENFSQVDEEEWQNILCSNGIYADYGAAFLPETFLQLVNAQPSSDVIVNQIGKMGRFSVTNDDGKLKVYISDLNSGKFFCISSEGENNQLASIISDCTKLATIDNRFSFFIGADIDTPIEGTAVFDSYIVLSESKVESKTAKSISGEALANEIFRESENISRLFAINPKTARRYNDSEDNIVYVQNQSSVKLSKTGYIEYHATTAGGGVALSENASQQTSLALVLYPLVFVSQSANETISKNSNISVYVSSAEENHGVYNVTLDYMFNGQPVVILDGGEFVHGVTCELNGGYIKSYKQYITDFEVGESNVVLPSSYSGIDLIFSNMSIEERNEKIKDMFIGYIDDGSSEIVPRWLIKTGDGNTIKY